MPADWLPSSSAVGGAAGVRSPSARLSRRRRRRARAARQHRRAPRRARDAVRGRRGVVSDPDPFAELRRRRSPPGWLAQLSAAVDDLRPRASRRRAVQRHGCCSPRRLDTGVATAPRTPRAASPGGRGPDLPRARRDPRGAGPPRPRRRVTRCPVPDVRWCETDPAVLGAPFFVMDRGAGTRACGATVDPRRRLAADADDAGARATVGLGAWTPWSQSTPSTGDGSPRASCSTTIAHAATLDAHVDRLVDWYRWSAAGREFPITDAALALLDRASIRRPHRATRRWCGATPRVGNMIFGDDAHGGRRDRLGGRRRSGRRRSTSPTGCSSTPSPPTRAASSRFPAGPTAPPRSPGTRRSPGVLSTTWSSTSSWRSSSWPRRSSARPTAGWPGDSHRRTHAMGHDNTVTQMLARRLGLPVPDLSPDYLAHRGGTVH